MIRYKVVRRRKSAATFEVGYQLRYEKNTVVEAVKETIGIFTFDTKKNAESWLKSLKPAIDYKIIKVKALDNGVRPKGRAIYTYGFRHLLTGTTKMTLPVPDGTICHQKVMVID